MVRKKRGKIVHVINFDKPSSLSAFNVDHTLPTIISMDTTILLQPCTVVGNDLLGVIFLFVGVRFSLTKILIPA